MDKKKSRFVVYSDYEKLWWRDDFGWSDLGFATKTSGNNSGGPVIGRWVSIEEAKGLPFADTQEMIQTEADRKVEAILRMGIAEHYLNECQCDLTDGGFGFCYAAQWLEGVTESEDVLRDLGV